MKTLKLRKEFCLVVALDIMTCRSEKVSKSHLSNNDKSLEKTNPS